APASVTERLNGLDAATLAVLQTAAVFGEHFTADDLAPFHETPGLEDAIDTAVSAGLLREVPDGFAFGHGTIRHAVLDSIGPLRRRRLHADIARRLIAAHGGSPAHAIEVAEHVHSAGDWPDEGEA